MKKRLIIILGIFLLIVIICVLVFKKNNMWDIMDWPWMVNEVSSYSVDVKERNNMVWEDVFVYDDDGDLVFSLDDQNQPQYLFALYENYIVLDSWTSASRREVLVYNIESKSKIFESDYYPWDYWLVINDNIVRFYKEIDESEIAWSLPQCENEYDNWYIQKYEYLIWDNQINASWDPQCAYFE